MSADAAQWEIVNQGGVGVHGACSGLSYLSADGRKGRGGFTQMEAGNEDAMKSCVPYALKS
jgi:hypothetical protein